MSNSIRIRTTPNGEDKYLKVNLEQDFDFLEILSLKISQEDAYRNFCSDYGVVVGRVVINSGFGVPNAKVSIFVPIDEIDSLDPEIRGLYPYEIVSDKNIDGIRYNLFPKTSETDNECFTPIGTFPSKREVLDNDILSEIYSKYYKFTTNTNHAGDFMIFGVPLGTYVLHVDADLSDIGIASQRPYDSISQGTPTKFFNSPTKYKGGINLDTLIQVKSANMGVNVQPFWGNQDNCEIGITRVDLDLNYNIIPSAMFMGSLFGDQDKDSVNKNCRPRKGLGDLCDQISGEGTIEMIRETIDGGIESFDVEGGRVIDSDGTWAYQIPMNLDYMVTDEFGNLVPSDNPNVGLATRASVRFRIGMDETGGIGRLRTRAKYLIPHNPSLGVPSEIDYEFGPKTKKTSFRSLYWNKIYSVNNFIARFQPNGTVRSRNMTGIKNVDSCVGSKNPFPYNKVNTTFSPIFFIICLLIKIVGGIIYIFNNVLIPVINFVIGIIKGIFDALCGVKIAGTRLFRFACKSWEYVPCIFIKCPFEGEGSIYAPGCKKGTRGFDAVQPPPNYYPNDGFCHGKGFLDLAGLDDCVAATMAVELNLFQFDFYNDWVNGSLFHFLLKYKRRKNSGKFCEYDCDDFEGSSMNDCHTNYIMDTCYDGGDNSEDKSYSTTIREGLIKKVGNDFYYAASTHDARVKMFATDIINLGSVFSCDWQGVPKIQQYLVPTTYKIPPITQELLEEDKSIVDVSGQFNIGCESSSLFFKINCLGIESSYRNCLNIRHISEFGVELDEYRFGSNGTPIFVDGIISMADIDADENGGKWVRDVFYGLNKDREQFNLNFPFTTNFNIGQPLPEATYDFTSYASNGVDYIDFRGYALNSKNSFSQPKNSFFFYFGLNPSSSGLDKLNQRFFTPCTAIVEDEFIVEIKTTPTSRQTTSDATMTFNFINGTSPFTYSVSGPNSYLRTGTVIGTSATTLTGLAVGTYQFTSTDDNGLSVIQSFSISGPPRLYGNAVVTQNATTDAASDGQITISQVGGGSGTYYYQLYDNNGGTVRPKTLLTNIPTTITNLPINILTNGQTPPSFGYRLVISDSDDNLVTISNLSVSGPNVLKSSVVVSDVTCFGGNNGSINLNISGGQPPYSISTLGPVNNGEAFESPFGNMTDLYGGTYTSTVIDAQSKTLVITTVLPTINSEILISKPDSSVLLNQTDVDNFIVPIYVLKGGVSGQPVKIQFNLDGTIDGNEDYVWINTTGSFVNTTTPVTFSVPRTSLNEYITIRIANASMSCFSEEIEIQVSEMTL